MLKSKKNGQTGNVAFGVGIIIYISKIIVQYVRFDKMRECVENWN